MGRGTQVPVTPAVLEWALEQAGKTRADLVAETKTDRETVESWFGGTSHPNLTQARKIAKAVRRPLAFLLWSEPPQQAAPSISFRSPARDDIRDLNPTERRLIRQAQRVQKAVSWLRSELGDTPTPVPSISVGSSVQEAAGTLRELLGASIEQQCGWPSAAKALDQWRERTEGIGILVFYMSLGKGSCRGMSLPNSMAPVIIVNTAYNHQARTYTLFHELAHLVSGTASACGHSLAAPNGKADKVERWCERVAAEALLPWPPVSEFLSSRGVTGSVSNLSVVRSIAKKFHVSLSAVVLRLIENKRATWALWNEIPKTLDDKGSGGQPPDEPRTTPVIRLAEFGRPAAAALVRGVESDLIDRSQASSYLKIDDLAYTEIRDRIAAESSQRADYWL